MGEIIADDGGVLRLTELMAKAPALASSAVPDADKQPAAETAVEAPRTGP